ncbi:MAG: flippase [Patescibacteria group bacterium]
MYKKIKGLLFSNTDTKQTVVKNIFWLTTGQIGSRFIRAVVIIYAARVLGAGEYGIFSYALGLAGFFTIFADIGVNSILTREVSQKPEKASEYFATSFLIKLTLLIGTCLIILFIVPYFSKIDAAILIIPFVAILTFFDNLREFSLSFFRGKEKMETEALVNIMMNITITLSGFFILSYFATAKAITLTYAASAGVGALLAIIFLRKEYFKIFSHYNHSLIKPIIKAALPIAILSLFGVFMLNIDMVMLGWWRSAEEIGFYSAAQKIVQVLYIIPGIIAAGIFPALSRFFGKGEKEKISHIMESAIAGVFFVALPLAIGGIILAKPIIQLIYGMEYMPAVPAFQILITTVLFVFPGTLFGNYVIAHNEQKKYAKYVAGAAIGNVLFNALFIPMWGIIGASLGTIIVQFGYNSLVWGMVKKINNFYTFRNIKKIIFSSILMGVVAIFMNWLGINIILNIIISGSVYLLMLFILKEPLILEVRHFFKLLKK